MAVVMRRVYVCVCVWSVAPLGVAPPRCQVLARPTDIRLSWQRPDIYTGPLTHYVMAVYSELDARTSLRRTVDPTHRSGPYLLYINITVQTDRQARVMME